MFKKTLNITTGVYYKTRNGYKVRIYALDGAGKYPVHAAIYEEDGWHPIKLTLNGSYVRANEKHNHDIVSTWEEPLDFDWDCLPAWINKYIAMDEDGDWYSFNDAPEEYYNYWAESELGQKLLKIDNKHIPKNFNGNWKDSLFKNPKYK